VGTPGQPVFGAAGGGGEGGGGGFKPFFFFFFFFFSRGGSRPSTAAPMWQKAMERIAQSSLAAITVAI